jgi:copper resistance protein B
MKRLFLLIAATALTSPPAFAQMNMNMPAMHMPGMKLPSQKKEAPGKKKGTARKSSAKAEKRTKETRSKKPGVHRRGGTSSMRGMEMPQGQTMPDMPGMQMPAAQSMQNMPGMNMPSGEHAGHDMVGMNAPEPPLAPPPAEALKGPENAADTVYGTAAMQPSRTFLLTKEHGRMTASRLLLDQLETRFRKGRDGYYVNAEGWYGGDIDKLWLKSEIEGDYGRSADQMEFQALWSHALDPWFNLQTGIRFDAEPRTRGRLVLGVEGLAPYWWEVNATAFVSDRGDVTARAEAEHDLRITQKLILQPRAELDFSLQDIANEKIGSGLSNAEFGARLRYEFVPNFAPYVGLVYERAIGRSARLVREDGKDPGGLQFTVGLRTWF